MPGTIECSTPGTPAAHSFGGPTSASLASSLMSWIGAFAAITCSFAWVSLRGTSRMPPMQGPEVLSRSGHTGAGTASRTRSGRE
ncbi:hypothetical protein MIAR_26100 [Microbacterium arabinogalactanolyticum]|nr:hypothetical protein MIAR_26100 [Microbacterium arabinogalactanolyticum]